MTNINVFGLAFVLLAVSPLTGADVAPQSRLQEVVVTATRADESVGDLPIHVSVISQAEIQQSAAHTVDALLRQIPGFNMLRQSDSMAGSPTTQAASLRGIGGTAASRSLVMLDGVPLHDAVTGRVYWGRIPRHEIERIEVVRGGGSTLWGNRTVGGVINIIPQAARARGLAFSGAFGSAGTIDLSGSASHLADDWSLSAYAAHYDTDGYYNIPAEQREPANIEVAKQTTNFGTRAAYEFSDNFDVYAGVSWLDEDRQDDTPLNVDNTEVLGLTSGFAARTADGSSWNMNLFADFVDFYDPGTRVIDDGERDAVSGLNQQDSEAYGINLLWSRSFGRHALSAGVDYQQIEAFTEQFGSYSDGVPSSVTEIYADQQLAGVFFQDVLSLSDAWEIIASGRFDYVANDGSSNDRIPQTGEFVAGENFRRNSETTFNPSLGFRYRINSTWSLRGAAYGGFRAATLRELYRSALTGGRSINLTANPDLGPEELKGVEGGVDFAPADSLLVRTTLFYNLVEDVVQNVTIDIAGDADEVIEPCGLVPAGNVCQQLQNVGELEATGVELEIEYRPHPSWLLFGSLLLQDVEISAAPGQPQLIGNDVRQSADAQWTAKVQYENPRFADVALQGRYVGGRFEDDLNTLDVDDFFLVDLVATRQIGNGSELFVAVENLFDEEYEVSLNSRGDREIGRDRFFKLGFRYRR